MAATTTILCTRTFKTTSVSMTHSNYQNQADHGDCADLTEPSNGATVDPPHPVPANDMEYGNAGMQQDHNFGTVPADSTAGAAPTPNFVPEDTNDEPEMTAPAPPERGRGRGRPRTRLQGQDAQPCGLAPLAPSRAHSVDRWDGIRTDVAPPLVRSRRSTDPVPIQRTPACLRR